MCVYVIVIKLKTSCTFRVKSASPKADIKKNNAATVFSANYFRRGSCTFIIKWAFICQLTSFIVVRLLSMLVPSCSVIYFLAPEWISSSHFCSFCHPTKLVASEGIGVEGLVLFWQVFQEWPSIRWSIVLESDFSLLNCYKKQMLQRYWKLQGTL